jgi:hypothetical protein
MLRSRGCRSDRRRFRTTPSPSPPDCNTRLLSRVRCPTAVSRAATPLDAVTRAVCDADHGALYTVGRVPVRSGGGGSAIVDVDVDSEGGSPAVVQLVTALASKHVKSVAASDYGCFAVDTAGVLYSWGRGDDGTLGNGGKTDRRVPRPVNLSQRKVALVAAGSHHVLLSTSSKACRGRLRMWWWCCCCCCCCCYCCCCCCSAASVT